MISTEEFEEFNRLKIRLWIWKKKKCHFCWKEVSAWLSHCNHCWKLLIEIPKPSMYDLEFNDDYTYDDYVADEIDDYNRERDSGKRRYFELLNKIKKDNRSRKLEKIINILSAVFPGLLILLFISWFFVSLYYCIKSEMEWFAWAWFMFTSVVTCIIWSMFYWIFCLINKYISNYKAMNAENTLLNITLYSFYFLMTWSWIVPAIVEWFFELMK